VRPSYEVRRGCGDGRCPRKLVGHLDPDAGYPDRGRAATSGLFCMESPGSDRRLFGPFRHCRRTGLPAGGEGNFLKFRASVPEDRREPRLEGPRKNRFWKSGRVRFAAAGAAALAVAALASVGGVGYAASLVGVSNTSPVAAQYPPSKVTICHHTHSQKNPFATITVSERALPAHLGHGDTIGPCPQQSLTPEQGEKPAKQHGKAQHHSKGQQKGKKKGHAGGHEGSTQESPLQGNGGQGHGQSQGQGHGQSQGQGEANGHSKANGHSHGQGNAPGNGQGHGQSQPKGKVTVRVTGTPMATARARAKATATATAMAIPAAETATPTDTRGRSRHHGGASTREPRPGALSARGRAGAGCRGTAERRRVPADPTSQRRG
jgi:hypothetical protein